MVHGTTDKYREQATPLVPTRLNGNVRRRSGRNLSSDSAAQRDADRDDLLLDDRHVVVDGDRSMRFAQALLHAGVDIVVGGHDLDACVDHGPRLVIAVLLVPGHAADEAGRVAVVDLDVRDHVVLLRWRRAESFLPSWVQPDEDGLSVGVERCR